MDSKYNENITQLEYTRGQFWSHQQLVRELHSETGTDFDQKHYSWSFKFPEQETELKAQLSRSAECR